MTPKNYRLPRSGPAGRPAAQINAACAPWIMLLPDAAEGLLGEDEQQALERHLAACDACSQEMAEAQRGLAWLNVLKEQAPEPPADLLRNILAQTTGFAEAGVSLPELPPLLTAADLPFLADTRPGWEHTGQRLLSWLHGDEGTWSSLLQTRLAMTAAMAFFSICLTLNLLGISVTQLDAQSLRKGSFERTVSTTGATIVRSIQGLRVVYRVESRVSEIRAPQDDTGAVSPAH